MELEMDYKTGEIVKADLASEYGFSATDNFSVVSREILEDGEHLYILKGMDGEYYEAYGSFIYK